MTTAFELFQATGRNCDDLGEGLRDDALNGVPGRLYCGDHLFIERKPSGHWSTVIGRQEFDSLDLTVIERYLFEFARSEGYCGS